MRLSIDGNEVQINRQGSCVIVNNRTYYSEDIVKSLVPEGENISLQGDEMYIGKIIKEKALLLDQYVYESGGESAEDTLTDSYGNMRKNVLYLKYDDDYVIYNLNREYTLMRFKIAVGENADSEGMGDITILADGEKVYDSGNLTKATEAFEVSDVPIKNCLLLEIMHASSGTVPCMLYDIEIYN